MLGRSKAGLVTAGQRQLIRERAELGQAQVTSYRRAFLNQETIMGTSYLRCKTSINSVVVYRDENDDPLFLQVHSFHTVQLENGPVTVIALGRTLQQAPAPSFLKETPMVIAEHLAHLNQAMFRVLPIQ